MFGRLKNIFAVFTLVLFFMPMVAEVLHAWHHSHEVQCTDNQIHYCTPKHHCSLCDYVPLSSGMPVTATYGFVQLFALVEQPVFYNAAVVYVPLWVPSLRGPPCA
jgi:hypothetical protein